MMIMKVVEKLNEKKKCKTRRTKLTYSVVASHKLYMVSLGGSVWYDEISIFALCCKIFHKCRI